MWILLIFKTNTSKRTTFFVLELYLVQKSHRTQTPSSILSCENCSSLWSACLYMMSSQAASSPSMPMSSLALVTFPPFPWLCTWRDIIPYVSVECVGSKVFTSQTCKTRCFTCCYPTAITPCQTVLLSMIQRTYYYAGMNPSWHRPN
jgi:hypothetical protein